MKRQRRTSGRSGIFLSIWTRGWGYSLDATELPSTNPVQADPPPRAPSGWIAVFLKSHPDAYEFLARAGISDQNPDLSFERTLPWYVRYQAGLFRFSGLLGDAYHDPCTIARAAPPWLAERSFESMDVTVRVANVFVNQQISTVVSLPAMSFPICSLCRTLDRNRLGISLRPCCMLSMGGRQRPPGGLLMGTARNRLRM